MRVERFLLREFLELNSRLTSILYCNALLGADFLWILCTKMIKFSFFSNFHFRHLIAFFLPLFMQNLHVVWENLSLQIGGWPLTSQGSLSGIWMRMHLDLMPQVDSICLLGLGQLRSLNAKYELIARISTFKRCIIWDLESFALYSSVCMWHRALVSVPSWPVGQ